MSLSAHLVERLANAIEQEMRKAAVGHCLRVDYLGREDAGRICQRLGELASNSGAEAYVLDPSAEGDLLAIRPERAIEIRNRKKLKLCLFVPAGLVDATASSLANAFAIFDLKGTLESIAKELLHQLPDDLRAIARRVHSVLRGPTRCAPEHWADYLGVVAEQTSLEVAGAELWRVGLIPDVGSEGLADRLERNGRCVLVLVRPARAQTSAQERLEEVGLRRGAVRDELLVYLQDKRLRAAREWLQGMVHEPYRGRITFEKWTFESGGQSDLEAIEVAPLLNVNGEVERWTKLSQPDGPGTQPVAPVGPRSKVSVRWNAVPGNPTNLKRWQAELIPSRSEYAEEEVAGVDLPAVKVSARVRRASLPLDLDLENLPVRAVQVRVTALDENGDPLQGAEGKVIEGLSDEFWLGAEPPAPVERRIRDTVPTLPYGRVKVALDLRTDALEEAPGQWSEHELHYFSVSLNGRRTIRVGLSPSLRAVEERCLEQPDEAGLYDARLDIAERLDPSFIQSLDTQSLEDSKVGTNFLARRRELFRLLRRQGHQGLVETARWDADLSKRARAYAAAYRELVTQAQAPDGLRVALRVDTLRLRVERSEGTEEAVLILPTHPLRILWYAAYADLLRMWEEELMKVEDDRRRLLDLELVGRVAPLNWPAFVPGADDTVFLFAQNLRFFWGLALPAYSKDPARQAADVARLVGLREDEASLTDLPPRRLASELQIYREVHPYLEALRLSIINPGAGSFVAEALRDLYEPASLEGDEGETPAPPRLEIMAHAHEPVPSRLASFEELQGDLYELLPKGRRHHLAPFFSVALRPISMAGRLPGGDVNLTIAIDQLIPSVRPVKSSDTDDSASFYGLLVRLLPSFSSEESGSVWQHRLSLPPQAPRERHPSFGPYTHELVDSQREYLNGVARLLDPSTVDHLPAITVELSPEDRVRIDTVHHVSDWVITLDRFFGVEFYDDPGDANLSGVARKYLLDYAPEFLEGLGHRMLVTTTHREEVEEILGRAMRELGFGLVEESVGEVLNHLKTISGRLALRILGDDARAREAVSLGVVAAYLRAKGELGDAILIPVDAHPELFGPAARRRRDGDARARCDLIRVRFQRSRLVATFIEVKSRAVTGQSEELLNRIVDQIEATEELFRSLFFQKEPVRLDHVLQRSRLVTVMRFYLRRAQRYGLISSESQLRELEAAIGRLEYGIPDLRVERWGFVVNLPGTPQRPTRLRDTEIRFLTARDVGELGLGADGASEESKAELRESDAQEAGATAFHAGPKALAMTEPDRSESMVTPVVEVTSSSTASPEGELGAKAAAPGSRASTAIDARAMASGVGPDRSEGIAAELPSHVEVALGITEGDQEPLTWKASVRGSPHLFALGIPGQGKSWMLTRILAALGQQGLPALVIDFHGQFGDSVNPYSRVARPTILDAAVGLPFSPFEAEASQSAGTNFWRTNAFAVAEIFQYVCGLGDIQRDVVYEAVRDCYRDLGFEEGVPDRLPTVGEVYKRLLEIETERGIRNVLPRCRPLLEMGLFQDTKGTLSDLGGLLRRGLVVDVHNLGLETLQLAAGAFILRKVYKDMFRWGETERLRLTVVLDEAHRLARDVTLPKIMKEGRKFGIVVVVASQGLSDFHPDVVGNAGTKVVFRTNFPMSKKVAGFLRARKSFDLASAIEQLDVGEAYVQTLEMASCARVRMYPLSR